MTRFAHASVLQHPERIHPLLWRGSQLARPAHKTVATGYPQLNAQLPGCGWPVGALIEVMQTQPGIGEIQLLKPALQRLENEGSIILLNPPHTPSAVCLQQWFPFGRRFLWIKTDDPRNTLWAAEKILQHNACAALVCWVNQAHPAAVHRLHLAARQTETLLFSVRPAAVAMQNSVAPLRLALQPTALGLDVQLLKRRGPRANGPVHLVLHTHPSFTPAMHHETMDQHLSDQPQPATGPLSASPRNGLAAIHA